MRNFSFSFAFSALLVFYSTAQEYIPIPDTLAIWRQSFSAMDYSTRYQIFTAEKISIDSFTYTSLRITGYTEEYGNSTSYSDSLYGYFRNDIANKTVYFRESLEDTEDKVLYEFNLEVGDTIPSYWYGNNWVNVIDSIDTVWMFGQARKRWSFIDYSFIPGAQGAIIEGVGSIHGFTWGLTIPYEPAWAMIECFSHNDSAYTFEGTLPPNLAQPIYTDASCWKYTNIVNFEDKTSFGIYPNPFNNQLNISSNNDNLITFSLYNYFGQLVEKLTFKNDFSINTEYLSKGLYFYEIKHSDYTRQTGKVLKE